VLVPGSGRTTGTIGSVERLLLIGVKYYPRWRAHTVMPAYAGIYGFRESKHRKAWVAACAGMTMGGGGATGAFGVGSTRSVLGEYRQSDLHHDQHDDENLQCFRSAAGGLVVQCRVGVADER
jgi:hypothetical protein